MGAARVVTMMAVVGVGAGAFLALATIPSLAPYQQHKPDRAPPAALPDRESEIAENPPSYGVAAPAKQNGDDIVRFDPRQRALVIELPRWVEDGGAWVALGQRVWDDWVEPDDTGYAADERRQPRYGARRGRDWEDSGDDYAPRDDRRWRDGEDDDAYGTSDRWSDAAAAPPARFADERRSEPDFAPARRSAPADDAAANAAERARQAAQDVHAAASDAQ